MVVDGGGLVKGKDDADEGQLDEGESGSIDGAH